MINQLSKNKDNPLLLALAAITSWLKEQNISYMVFGGIANSVYGNPRQTFDIDIKLLWIQRNQSKHLSKNWG